jgi:hypothetical protein
MLRDNIIRGGGVTSNLVWKGPWGDSTSYIINDLVENDGDSYIAIAAHTSTFNDEPGVGVNWQLYWDLFVEGGQDGVDGVDGVGAYTSCDKLILEMEMAFKTAYLCHYKTFTYNVSKQLTDIEIWTDSTATIKLFHKDLTYDVEKNLIQIDLTRISDGSLLTSVFNYNASKQLISIERSGYCSCSSSSSSTSSSSSSSST